ncbi:MAG: hypothetical protein RMJ84_03510 [Sandaracinaceae bacterium]|nr:hypothetical protein [Sandaracinaceae bacterium]
MLDNRGSLRVWIMGLGIGGVVCFAPAKGQSQDCAPPPLAPLNVLPAVGAQNVTIDAWVRVEYPHGYFDENGLGPGGSPEEMLRLFRCGPCASSCDSPQRVEGNVQRLQDFLFFVPSQPLEHNTLYSGQADGKEDSLRFRFCTGSSEDRLAPQFTAQSVRIRSEEVGPSCDLPEGGFRVGVFVPEATDDGPLGSIEYLLFLTRADGLEAPRLVDRVRHFGSDEITMRLLIDGAMASKLICIQVGVVDGAGHLTMGEREFCFDPLSKVRFYGCALTRAKSSPILLITFCLGLAPIIWKRARRMRYLSLHQQRKPSTNDEPVFG